MPKRKAEGPPEIEVENTLGASEFAPTAELSHTEQGPVAGLLARGERREGPSISHLSPVQEVPATAQVPGDHPFWELLALLGYEIW